MGYKIKRILVGTNQVRPSGWKPGANTLLYLPLVSSANDESGKGTTMTNNGVIFGTYHGVECGNFESGSIRTTNFTTPSEITISFRAYQTQLPSDVDGKFFIFYDGTHDLALETIKDSGSVNFYNGIAYLLNKNVTGGWYYFNITRKNGDIVITVKGNNYTNTWNATGQTVSMTASYLVLGDTIPGVGFTRKLKGCMSQYIVENKKWTAQEIADYYNQTKGTYNQYEVSYDFTTGSVADMQSKGWTVPSGSSITSSGYKNTSNNRSFIKLSSSQLNDYAQDATKLVMKLHWAGTGHTERVLSIMNGNTEICNLYGNYVANSATFGQVSYVNESISEYGQNGDFTTVFTIDIQNKTWEYVSTNHTTLTGTITDASIASFKNSNGVGLYFQGSGYMKDISITIS